MKRFYMMNGWRDAPHCWWRYLLTPFNWGKTPGWYVFSAFGFAFFLVRQR